ncbi:hypothetical protein [Acetobacter nitrogenifigens]
MTKFIYQVKKKKRWSWVMHKLFQSIDTKEKAEAACDDGSLVKTLLLPEELGGKDIPPNVVYIPLFAEALKKRSVDALIAAIEKGMAQVSIIPDYKDNSFVPFRIVTTASYPDRSTGGYHHELNIW